MSETMYDVLDNGNHLGRYASLSGAAITWKENPPRRQVWANVSTVHGWERTHQIPSEELQEILPNLSHGS